MNALERLIGAERSHVLRKLVTDESVREELRRAGTHAAAVARAGRGRTVGGFSERSLQRHGIEVMRSLERVVDIARGTRSRRRRRTLIVLAAAAAAAGIGAAAAKAAL